MISNVTYNEEHEKIGDLLLIAAYVLAFYLFLKFVDIVVTLILSINSAVENSQIFSLVISVIVNVSFIAFFAIAAYISIKCRANFPSARNIFLMSAILWVANALIALTETIMLIIVIIIQRTYYILFLPNQILGYIKLVVMLIALGGWYYSFERMNLKRGNTLLMIYIPIALVITIAKIVLMINYQFCVNDPLTPMKLLIILSSVEAVISIVLILLFILVILFLALKKEEIKEAVIAEKRFKSLVRE